VTQSRDISIRMILKFVMDNWDMEVDTRLIVLSIAESDGTVMIGGSSSRSALVHMRSPTQWTQRALCCQKSGQSVNLITFLHLMTIIRMCVPCCGLVVRVPGYRSKGPGSIPGSTNFSQK
jgi:hypothetical protein